MNSPKGTYVFLTFTRRIYTLTAFSASLFGVKLAQHALNIHVVREIILFFSRLYFCLEQS